MAYREDRREIVRHKAWLAALLGTADPDDLTRDDRVLLWILNRDEDVNEAIRAAHRMARANAARGRTHHEARDD